MSLKDIHGQLAAGFGEIKESTWQQEALERQKDAGWRKYAQAIALSVSRAIRSKKMTQVQLAALMGITPQQLNKWLKGNENFTLEAIYRLEQALEIRLLQLPGNVASVNPINTQSYSTEQSYELAEEETWDQTASAAVLIPLSPEYSSYQALSL